MAERAQNVLLVADGTSNTEIAKKIRAIRTTVISWRTLYTEAGIEGLVNHNRPG